MVQRLYSIRDIKTDFKIPFAALTDQEASRTFARLINDPKAGMIHDYYEDYELYFVGMFDSDTGLFEQPDRPSHLVKGMALKLASGPVVRPVPPDNSAGLTQ